MATGAGGTPGAAAGSRGRLLVVSHYLHPHIGGIETVVDEQTRRLAARGWDVEVFTSRLGAPSLERRGGVTVRRFRALNWQERALSVPVPLMAPAMLAALRRAAPSADVVVAHGHAYVGSAYAGLAARRAGTPLVLVQHSPFVEYPAPLEAVERAVDRTLGRWLLEGATLVVSVSAHTDAYVRAIAPAATSEVIHSGVDTARFRPDGPRLLPAGDRPVVVTLRRLVPRNGIEVLLDAWMSRGLGEVADLVVGGDGEQRAALERAAAADRSVRFLGRVADVDVPALYRSADVFVLPSVSGEGFGLVAAEALASGVPVVTTDAGATGELVRHGEDGLVVARRDPQALAAAIAGLLGDRGRRTGMAARAAARRPSLGWDHSIDALETALGRAAGPLRRSGARPPAGGPPASPSGRPRAPRHGRPPAVGDR